MRLAVTSSGVERRRERSRRTHYDAERALYNAEFAALRKKAEGFSGNLYYTLPTQGMISYVPFRLVPTT
jgi:hypothetical protein